MRERAIFSLLASVAIVGVWWTVARADQPAGADSELPAIRAAAQAYLDALERGDEAALRLMWTPDGDYVDAAGESYRAQDLFVDGYEATTYEATATTDGGKTAVEQQSALRLISPDVALEDGAMDLGLSDDGNLVQGRYSAVWVKRDGRWLLASLRESTTAAPSARDHLEPLEWLLGEWTGSNDDAQMIVSTHWGDGGNYLLREFLVSGSDGQAVGGTERIGWDAASGEIKSWTFDTQGNRGEARWRPDGDKWGVEATEVLADGTKASTSATYQRQGDESYLWQVTSAKVGEAELPPRQVEFHRAKGQ